MKEHMITEHNKQDSDDPGQLAAFYVNFDLALIFL